MKVFAVLIFLFAPLTAVSAQKTAFLGTVYDPNGAVVVGARINALHETGQRLATTSGDDGQFRIELATGIYKLEVSAPGFISIEVTEYLIVDAKQMRMDFVLFGGRFHEPCGVSGADCLPQNMLRKEYKVRYSPTLKEIRNNFSPETKPKSK